MASDCPRIDVDPETQGNCGLCRKKVTREEWEEWEVRKKREDETRQDWLKPDRYKCRVREDMRVQGTGAPSRRSVEVAMAVTMMADKQRKRAVAERTITSWRENKRGDDLDRVEGTMRATDNKKKMAD
jgi:hypothetical protein